MKVITTLVGFLCLVFLTFSSVSAKDWRGIEPLRSSRSDVERLLGPPAKSTMLNTYLYDLQNEQVFIQFAAKSCEESQHEAWRVPLNTVVSMLVAPKGALHLNAMSVTKNYEKKVDASWEAHIFYSDLANGEIIETNNGMVVSVTYRPAAKDGHLLCYGSVGEWMKAVGIVCILPRVFDQYGDLSREDENARLDNFAIQLQEEPSTGYIKVSGEKGRAKANRAVKYLINVRGIKAWRLLTALDDSREEPTFELWDFPLGQRGP